MKNKLITILLATCIALSTTACDSSTETDTPNTQQTENSQQEEEIQSSDDIIAIELVAGEQGQYGKLITMNEESFYVYYVPAGTYTVTNEGEYMTQISVYEGFARNEETGYDEYTATGDIILLDAGTTDTLEVPDGWFIEIHEPTHISLTSTMGE